MAGSTQSARQETGFPPGHPVRQILSYSHFADEETEAQRGLMTWPNSHSKYRTKPGLQSTSEANPAPTRCVDSPCVSPCAPHRTKAGSASCDSSSHGVHVRSGESKLFLHWQSPWPLSNLTLCPDALLLLSDHQLPPSTPFIGTWVPPEAPGTSSSPGAVDSLPLDPAPQSHQRGRPGSAPRLSARSAPAERTQQSKRV